MHTRAAAEVLAEKPLTMGPLATMQYTADPFAFYSWAQKKRGDPYLLHGFDGPAFTTSNPVIIKDILATQPESFGVYMIDLLRPLVGSHSVLTMAQEPHKRDRKLLMPHFHGERLRVYGDIIRDIAEKAIGEWPKGSRFLFYPTAQKISMNTIVRVVFGIDDEASRQRWVDILLDLNRVFKPSTFFITAFRRSFFGLGPWAKFQRVLKRADAMLFEEIAKRRQAQTGGQDILSLLLASRYDDGSAMSDQQIRDELMGVLIAGHETTSFALSWAVHYCLRQPETLAKLRAELDALPKDASPEAVAALPYLGAVCNETLRLHPIIADVARKLVADVRIGEYALPSGLGVIIPVTLVHADPELYPEPRVFKPERFLERKYGPAEFLPFGGGHKRCLGAAMALYEMKLALAVVIGKADISLVSRKPLKPKRYNVSLGPSSGVALQYTGLRS